jgi:thiamine-monophosphate kinase
VDVSDGLLGDLGHILQASGVGAQVDADAAVARMLLPAHPLAATAGLAPELLRLCALSGGDDYELLFTAPADRRDAVAAAAQRAGTSVARIGRIEAERGLRIVDAGGKSVAQRFGAFDHFA